jgi:hypothetical protein
MPRVIRRPKRRRENYTEEQLRQLTEGVSLYPDEGFADEAAERAGWEELGVSLTEAWIREQPGSRPAGWWKYESPERRRRVDGVQNPFDNRLRQDHVERVALENPAFRERAYRLYFGVPACCIGAIKDDFEATYEGELAYLDRLGLLTPTERHELYGEPLPESEGESCQG